MTWVKGPHILKFGGRIYHRNILFTDARDHNGTYGFTGVMTQNPASAAGTGDGFADFLLGYPANSTRSNPATWWGGYGTYWHGFFQDDFKVANSLTLEPGLPLRVHAVADRLQRPGGGLRSHAREVDHRLEQDQRHRSQRAAARRCRLHAVLGSDSDQQPGRGAAEHHEERHEADRAAAGLRVASVRRQHGRSRRLRHLLRGRRHRRPAELQLHSVPGQRDGHGGGQCRSEPHARGFLAGRAGGSIGGLGDLGAAAARSAARTRSAVEPGLPAAAVQPSPRWKSTTWARPATTRRRPRTSTCRRRAPAASRRGGRIRGSATCPCRRRRSRATTRRCR